MAISNDRLQRNSRCDGQFGSQRHLLSARITPSINPNYYRDAIPELLWGLHVPVCDAPVLDWLKRRTADKVRDLGLDVLDGHECRKVEFDNVPVQGLYRTRAWVWFDAGADWLPRKIACAPLRYVEIARRQLELDPKNMEPISITFEPGEVAQAYEVHSFMQVEDPLLGRKRWFPKSRKIQPGPHSSAHASDFEVDTVVLNQPIDSSRFVPVPVPGTRTEDFMTGAGLVVTIHGGEEGLIIHRNLARAQSVETLSQQRSAVTKETTPKTAVPSGRISPNAQPKRAAWWLPVVAAAGLLMLSVSIRKWMASRS